MMMAKKTDHQAFVTYELEQGNPLDGAPEVLGVKGVVLRGKIASWKVGNFEPEPGKKVYGIEIIYESAHGSEVIEVPANAAKVELHVGSLPQRFEEALQRAG